MDVKTLGLTDAFSKIPGLDTLVSHMKSSWTAIKTQVGSNRIQITRFMTDALDGLITYLVEFEISGEDKKAIVLLIMNDLYDWVVAQAIPFWARPFGRVIKDFVINVLVSHAIDWIVSKYKNGMWNKPTAIKVMSAWGVPEGHQPN